MSLILEGIVTTTNADGSVNISPMGPEVDEGLNRFLFKPFKTSTTYLNLKRSGCGVFHVTDDVELLAQAAVGQPEPLPRLVPATAVEGWILADACRWFEFRVGELDDRQERTRIEVDVVERGRNRDFFGFNRAKHAIVEAAILATRVSMLPAEQLEAEFARLATLVDKTGGLAEQRALAFLRQYVQTHSTR